MPTIYCKDSFSEEEKVKRHDFIDKHTPYVICDEPLTYGQPFTVKVRVGSEYAHIDDFNHYIKYVAVYDHDKLLVKTELSPCIVSADEHRGNVELSFVLVANQPLYLLNAHCYCTKHGLWSGEVLPLTVK